MWPVYVVIAVVVVGYATIRLAPPLHGHLARARPKPWGAIVFLALAVAVGAVRLAGDAQTDAKPTACVDVPAFTALSDAHTDDSELWGMVTLSPIVAKSEVDKSGLASLPPELLGKEVTAVGVSVPASDALGGALAVRDQAEIVVDASTVASGLVVGVTPLPGGEKAAEGHSEDRYVVTVMVETSLAAQVASADNVRLRRL